MGIDEERGGAEQDPRMLRISNADRDRTVEILRDAAVAGRLDATELDERVEQALLARTFVDLEPLTQDLPGGAPVPPRAPVPVLAAGDVARWEVRGDVLHRDGVWKVPRRIELSVYGGSAHLDYTSARIPEGGASTLRVAAHGGSVLLIVPPGTAVDLSGVTIHGGQVRDSVSRYMSPDVPVTHVITVTGAAHGASVQADVSDAGRGPAQG